MRVLLLLATTALVASPVAMQSASADSGTAGHTHTTDAMDPKICDDVVDMKKASPKVQKFCKKVEKIREKKAKRKAEREEMKGLGYKKRQDLKRKKREEQRAAHAEKRQKLREGHQARKERAKNTIAGLKEENKNLRTQINTLKNQTATSADTTTATTGVQTTDLPADASVADHIKLAQETIKKAEDLKKEADKLVSDSAGDTLVNESLGPIRAAIKSVDEQSLDKARSHIKQAGYEEKYANETDDSTEDGKKKKEGHETKAKDEAHLAQKKAAEAIVKYSAIITSLKKKLKNAEDAKETADKKKEDDEKKKKESKLASMMGKLGDLLKIFQALSGMLNSSSAANCQQGAQVATMKNDMNQGMNMAKTLLASLSPQEAQKAKGTPAEKGVTDQIKSIIKNMNVANNAKNCINQASNNSNSNSTSTSNTTGGGGGGGSTTTNVTNNASSFEMPSYTSQGEESGVIGTNGGGLDYKPVGGVCTTCGFTPQHSNEYNKTNTDVGSGYTNTETDNTGGAPP